MDTVLDHICDNWAIAETIWEKKLDNNKWRKYQLEEQGHYKDSLDQKKQANILSDACLLKKYSFVWQVGTIEFKIISWATSR